MRFNEFKIVESKRKKQKNADKVRGSEPTPAAQPGRTEHPFRGRLVGESLNEAEARIQHAEDIIFWEGSAGAARAIESLKSLEQGAHKDVTIKWDGSPAIIFGRDSDGNFILTDKSGFGAKGYDGKAKSAKDLQAMLMNRPGAQRDPEGYGQFASNMADIFDEYEKATHPNFRGFFKGDLLYFNTPNEQEGSYVFKPNIVTYSVKTDSEIGRKIGQSKTGIVLHRYMSTDGTERPLNKGETDKVMSGAEVLVLPPITAQQPPKIDDSSIKDLQARLSKSAGAIDALLDSNSLAEQKVKDLPKIFYAYLNSKVDTGLNNLAKDFPGWVSSAKLSDPKKRKILEIINANSAGYNAMWDMVAGIMRVKDDIINQLENQEQDITASINGQAGGEGYVLAHPQGDIKLVPREFFTKANRSVER